MRTIRLLMMATALATGLAGSAYARDDRVVVMTSYPDDMVSLFEAAFEKANPGVAVQVVWKHAREAAAALRQSDHGGVDVYWTPSVGTFPAMRDAGLFQPLAVDRAALPGRIGAQPISDPKGFYEAFEVAGYGIVTNPAALARLGLAEPRSWSDLTDPRYAGRVAMPVAAQVGFSPELYDVILQGLGWDRGWALLSEIAGNAQPVGNGGGITDLVESGKAAAGLTIDFFVRSAIANGHALRLSYPDHTAFLPAQVALVTDAPHPEAAHAFVDFVLGPEGQRLLFHPDVRRYPVRPAVYTDAPPGTVNPFARPDSASFAYDPNLGIARAGLIVALFEAMVTKRHDQLVTLWGDLHRAEEALAKSPDAAASAPLAERIARARSLAGLTPVTADEASDPAYLAPFRSRRTAHGGDKTAAPGEGDWTARIDRAQAEAAAIIADALAALPSGR